MLDWQLCQICYPLEIKLLLLLLLLIPQFNDRQFVQELNTISITEENILKAIDRIKSTVSQGPDYIYPMLIKECKKVPIESFETDI